MFQCNCVMRRCEDLAIHQALNTFSGAEDKYSPRYITHCQQNILKIGIFEIFDTLKSCKLLLSASPLRDLDRTPECMITRCRGELITRSGSRAAEARLMVMTGWPWSPGHTSMGHAWWHSCIYGMRADMRVMFKQRLLASSSQAPPNLLA